MKVILSLPLSALSGVGAVRIKQLAKLGLNTVEDLLYSFPRRYHDLRNFKQISQLFPGETASVKVSVLARDERKTYGRVPYLKVGVGDGSGVLYLVFFNQPYLKDSFAPGEEFFVNGRVELYRSELTMSNPLYEKCREGRRDVLLPIYPLTRGISEGYLRKLVRFVLDELAEYPEELLPFRRRQDLRLANARYALTNMHFPRSDADLERARNYLVFHEFFKLQAGLLLTKRRLQKEVPLEQRAVSADADPVGAFEQLLPFRLTAGQREVIADLVADIVHGRVVQRLVQGEVGSGKTVVAVFLLWLFARRGHQGIFLAPTEILAEQHFLNWQEFFLRQDIPVRLYVGGLPEKEKDDIRTEAAGPGPGVFIGTHALLSAKLNFRSLEAVVVDEQHKFGVEQRRLLAEKGGNPHYLLLTATPIPRSVALTVYGSLDCSTVGELPRGKRNVVTYLFSLAEKERVYRFAEQQAEAGRQGFFVTPSIAGGEDISSAVEEYELLRGRLGADRVALIHGRLSREEKERVMNGFRAKSIPLLVATAVVESGIDVPDASYIIIDQAERFGLAQLHQLRGRIGRSGEIGYCFLVAHAEDPDTAGRLETFLQTDSGLEIADLDLKLRGPGDLLGTRQHGIMPLKIGNIVTDLQILSQARREAQAILDLDPRLERFEHAALRRYLIREKHETV